MGLTDRAFVWETSEVTLTDANGAGSDIVIPLFEIFRRMTIRIETEMMEAEVAEDPADSTTAWRYPRPRRRNWTVDLEAVVNVALDSGATYNFITWASNLADGDGTFLYKGPIGTGNNRFKFEGPVVLDNVDLNYGGEEAIQNLRLIGYGPPTTVGMVTS